MMKITAFLMGILLTFSALAQVPGMNRGGQQISGRFYGRVVDASKKGIEAASVLLVQDRLDSATKQRKEQVVGGMLTQPNGDFSIENIPVMGRYRLRITGIGYKAHEQAVAFERPARNGNTDPAAMLSVFDKDLGNIELSVDDKVLSGVTVTASKPLLQMGIDRKIFNVEKNITSAGGTAVDVMKNVPSVSVDIDGNVTLRNNAPQIFVDGRPTNLTLEQIPADAIESVEIITNPSAKFDASGGTAGILNIVLKKQKRVGYAGNVRTNIDSRARLGFGGDVNVRQNKINFFASTHISQRKSLSEGFTFRQTKGDTTYRLFQNDDNEMKGMFGFGRAGFDYFINNRNTITVSGTMARGSMKPSTLSNIDVDSVFRNGSIREAFSQRSSNSDNEFRNWGTQIGFKHIFPRAGHEWTADLNFNQGRNNNENIIGTDYFNMPGKTFNRNYRQKQVGRGENENLVIQTDYANPLSDKSKLEFGARASIRKVFSAQNFFALASTGAEMPLGLLDVDYKSEDRVYAGYATYSSRIKNFGYQLGLRAESSNYEGTLVSKQQAFNIEFPISFFPSVFLSQKLNESDDLQFNYSRRINRPSFWQLFPFTDYSDSLNINRGNPNLNPEFTNSLELSYSKVFKNRDNFIASVYFKNTNDLITRFQGKDTANENVLVNTYINANRSYVTGLELTGRNKITKFWDLTTNANFFTSKIDLESVADPDQFLSYFLKLNNNFRLPKNFTLQLSADYTSKIISSPGGSGGGSGRGGFGGGGGMFGGGGASAAQGYIRPNYGVDAALRYEFLKNKAASLSLNVNDIFRTKKYDAHSESLFFVQDIERRRDPQVFRLNFNLRFGKFDANLFKRKNNRSENETQMEGIGM
jgi:outer membrane receptor protein involved in Fe transport